MWKLWNCSYNFNSLPPQLLCAFITCVVQKWLRLGNESLYMVLITQPVFFNPAITFSCIIFHRIPDFFSQTSFIKSVSLCTFMLLSLLRILCHSSQYLILLRKNEIPQKSKKCYIKLHLMYIFAIILMHLINFVPYWRYFIAQLFSF